jgi:hypothetical protein
MVKREADARLELKRRRAVFDAIREKARQDRSLDFEDFRCSRIAPSSFSSFLMPNLPPRWPNRTLTIH